MAAAKTRVSDIAKRMGKSEKAVTFQLQSLGAQITDAHPAPEPEAIPAPITGKKLRPRAKSVITRDDTPQPAAPAMPPPPPPSTQIRSGPTGPRARAPQGPRPNYAGQQPVQQPSRPMGTGAPQGQRPPMGARPAGPGGAPRPMGPGGPRPM